MKRFGVLWLCIILVFSGTIVGLEMKESTVMSANSAVETFYTPHAPIRINSNADFPAIATSGNGNPGTPWIIGGWEINGTGYSYGIYVGNTTQDYIIQDCYVHDSFDYGIYLFNSDYGTVRNNTIDSIFSSTHDTGIYISQCVDLNVIDNRIKEDKYPQNYQNSHAIYMSNGNRVIFYGNNISNYGWGIRCHGDNIEYENNVIDSCRTGIEFYDAGVAENNTITNSTWGFFFWYAKGVYMRNNIMVKSGIRMCGGNVDDFNENNIDTSNTVNGKPVYYLKNVTNELAPIDGGQLILANCTNITVNGFINSDVTTGVDLAFSKNITISNCSFTDYLHYGIRMERSNNITISNCHNYGTSESYTCSIYMYQSNDNVILNNTMTGGRIGSYISRSSRNIIDNNEIFDNTRALTLHYNSNKNLVYNNTFLNHDDGLRITYESENNTIYYNNFINNVNQSFDECANNRWNLTYPEGGNYWSDYTGVDYNSTPSQDVPPPDGIGDTPYTFNYNQDNYPFTEPNGWEIEEVSIEDWPMQGHDLEQTGYNPDTIGPNSPNLLWNFSLPNPPGEFHYFCGSSPIVSYGRVYIGGGGDNGTLFCIDKETGEIKWTRYFSQPITTGALDDGKLYISGGRRLYCLDALTGVTIWWISAYGSGGIFAAPKINGDYLYYGAGLSIICRYKNNGTVLWFTSIGNGQYTSPAFSNDKLFITSENGYIYCINAVNGTIIWQKDIGAWHNDPTVSNGRVYVGSLYDFYCLDEYTGDILWSFTPLYRASLVPGIFEDKVIVPAFYAYYKTPGITYCINATTGDIFWETNIGSRAGPAIADGKVYLGDSWSNITCLDLLTGDILWLYEGADPADTVDSSHAPCPAISDGKLFVATYEGTLYCFGQSSNSTATSTGPQGAGHDPIITITYDWTASPDSVDLFYSNDTGNSWNYLGTDTSVDGSYDWGPASNPSPKPSKYWWIANAQNGSDDVGNPANGTPPEAGPYNWKTHDLKINDGLPILNPSDNWELVSVPLDVSGDPRYVFDDDNWGDGGTKWDVIQWYDQLDPADPWKSYSIHRPPGANDAVIVDNTRGFWIHIINNDGDGALTVGEGSMPISTSIDLYAGWNMVSYPTETEMIVADALLGTGADRVEVFDPAEPYHIKEVGPTYLMKSGEGYWVHVPADTVWIVDW